MNANALAQDQFFLWNAKFIQLLFPAVLEEGTDVFINSEDPLPAQSCFCAASAGGSSGNTFQILIFCNDIRFFSNLSVMFSSLINTGVSG